MNNFNDGKQAALNGVCHLDNPHNFATEAHDEWAKGWMVGDDPVVWGHLAPVHAYVANGESIRTLIVEAYSIDPLETPWEAGRQASQNKGVMADNPYEPETVNGDEWDRGFTHGCLIDIPAIVDEDLASLALPTVQVKVRPTRAFWAVLNNLQIARGYSVEELSKYIGLDQDRLTAEMVDFGYYDNDGIPLFEVAVA